jgi:polysaccharide biosynthesis/export protein
MKNIISAPLILTTPFRSKHRICIIVQSGACKAVVWRPDYTVLRPESLHCGFINGAQQMTNKNVQNGLKIFLFIVFLGIALLPGQGQAEPPSEYRLGTGDVLEVTVWKENELSRLAVIRPDGYISFPLVGEVPAAGRTVKEVQQEIAAKIQDYIPDTFVAVMLHQLRATKIYVLGKVAQPGAFVMEGETRVMQALALAGGLTRFADKSHIYILRQEDGGDLVSLGFDYDDVARGRRLHLNIILQPGDTIVVP